MSDKHYKEQKMLIENFRKWQEGPDIEEEIIQEDITEIYLMVKNFIAMVGTVYDILQMITFSSAALYTIAPYLKIAMHHPKIYAALTSSDGAENKSSAAMRALAVGLREADNAGQFLDEFVDEIVAAADAEGKKRGIMDRLKGAVGVAIFISILLTTSFPIIGGGVAKLAPATYLRIRNAYRRGKKKKEEIQAKIKGVPSPDEQAKLDAKVEEELKELEELEAAALKARELAEPVAEFVSSIKEDPIAAAEELGVELSEEDLKNMRVTDSKPKSTSRAQKVDIPSTPKKLTPDEIADRKASADASRERRKK
mgnify:CR=1 FL=1